MIGLINVIQIDVDFRGEGSVNNKIYSTILLKVTYILGTLWINGNKINLRVKMKYVHIQIQLKLMIVMMNGIVFLLSTTLNIFKKKFVTI